MAGKLAPESGGVLAGSTSSMLLLDFKTRSWLDLPPLLASQPTEASEELGVPVLPRELQATIFGVLAMLNARERAAVRIQARVRACIVRQWGLPALVPSYVSDMRHWSLVPYNRQYYVDLHDDVDAIPTVFMTMTL